jgi:branched-chain amino acid transport system ATP-binding protein
VAVDHVSVEVVPGTLKSIIGPNGAGKTTLFNLLSGQYRPTEGRIVFQGRDITRWTAAARTRLGIGRSFQLTNVFPTLSVLENVRLAVQARRGLGLVAWRDYRRFPELEDRAYALLTEVLLETKWAAPAGTLAQGEKRKLELGILLALEPALLLLDEPTAGMSPQETGETIASVRDIVKARGLTLLFTEHDMSVVFGIAERISVLHHGEIIASGAPDAVRNDPEVKRVYLGEHAHG